MSFRLLTIGHLSKIRQQRIRLITRPIPHNFFSFWTQEIFDYVSRFFVVIYYYTFSVFYSSKGIGRNFFEPKRLSINNIRLIS